MDEIGSTERSEIFIWSRSWMTRNCLGADADHLGGKDFTDDMRSVKIQPGYKMVHTDWTEVETFKRRGTEDIPSHTHGIEIIGSDMQQGSYEGKYH